jgi:hypothetical protein
LNKSGFTIHKLYTHGFGIVVLFPVLPVRTLILMQITRLDFLEAIFYIYRVVDAWVGRAHGSPQNASGIAWDSVTMC